MWFVCVRLGLLLLVELGWLVGYCLTFGLSVTLLVLVVISGLMIEWLWLVRLTCVLLVILCLVGGFDLCLVVILFRCGFLIGVI